MNSHCDEASFRKFVEGIEGLCAWGFCNESLYGFNTTFYRANRQILLNSYHEFILCCNWLRENCTRVKTISTKSPNSRQLQQMAKRGGYVGHGSMIAAIMFLGIPCKIDAFSPNVLVGISLKSACFKPLMRPLSQQWRMPVIQ